MIIIVSFEDNDHVERVRRHLTTESVVVSTEWFPATMSLDARLSGSGERVFLTLPDGCRIDTREVGAVWNRRIRPMRLHDDLTDETARLFAWSESNEALQGVWQTMNCFWMNPPQADEVAQRKIRQLQIARQVGLTIPDTLVTNEPDVARAFIEFHGPGNVIRKAFRNIPQAPSPTRIVTGEELAIIDSVRYAPVTFQRFIPAQADLRVTIVEQEVFSAEIPVQVGYEADYRYGLGSATVSACELPDDVSERLIEFMRILNVNFGAIDLRRTPEGEYVFLEINPAGEYLFISERTNQPIPAAIAASLERHDRESCQD